MISIGFLSNGGIVRPVRLDTFYGRKKPTEVSFVVRQRAVLVSRVVGILCALEITLRFRYVQRFQVPVFERRSQLARNTLGFDNVFAKLPADSSEAGLQFVEFIGQQVNAVSCFDDQFPLLIPSTILSNSSRI